jgi:hypothetical protein
MGEDKELGTLGRRILGEKYARGAREAKPGIKLKKECVVFSFFFHFNPHTLTHYFLNLSPPFSFQLLFTSHSLQSDDYYMWLFPFRSSIRTAEMITCYYTFLPRRDYRPERRI